VVVVVVAETAKVVRDGEIKCKRCGAVSVARKQAFLDLKSDVGESRTFHGST
jgi:hypothetical protein